MGFFDDLYKQSTTPGTTMYNVVNPDKALDNEIIRPATAKVQKGLGDILQAGYNQFSNLRGKVAEAFKDEGPVDYAIRGKKAQKGDSDPYAYGMHSNVAKNMMKKFSPYIGEGAAEAGIRAVGTGNETLAGILAAVKGDPILDERGFSVGDLMANERGIDKYYKQKNYLGKWYPSNIKSTLSNAR